MKKTYIAPKAKTYNVKPAQMMAVSTMGIIEATADESYTPLGGGDGNNDSRIILEDDENFLEGW